MIKVRKKGVSLLIPENQLAYYLSLGFEKVEQKKKPKKRK